MKLFLLIFSIIFCSTSFASEYVYTKKMSVLADNCDNALVKIKSSLESESKSLFSTPSANVGQEDKYKVVSKEISEKCFEDQFGNFQMNGILKYKNLDE